MILARIGPKVPGHENDLTIFGDTVNLASRLQAACRSYGVDLLISDHVHEQIQKSFVCRSVDMVIIKGKKDPVALFTVIGPASTLASMPNGLTTYEEGIRLQRLGRIAEARAALALAAAEGLDDQLTQTHLARCNSPNPAPVHGLDGLERRG